MEAILENDVLAIRNGERLQLWTEIPDCDRWVAVQVVSVTMPEGQIHSSRPRDGMPVEQAAIIACEMVKGKWQWTQLSPPSKEFIGDMLFDSDAERGRWYYLSIESTRIPDPVEE